MRGHPCSLLSRWGGKHVSVIKEKTHLWVTYLNMSTEPYLVIWTMWYYPGVKTEMCRGYGCVEVWDMRSRDIWQTLVYVSMHLSHAKCEKFHNMISLPYLVFHIGLQLMVHCGVAHSINHPKANASCEGRREQPRGLYNVGMSRGAWTPRSFSPLSNYGDLFPLLRRFLI